MRHLTGGLEGDERGATPVVGIILIVALTLLLAAVVGQSIFGYDLLQSPEAAPAVSFSSEYDGANENLTIVHESGTTLENQTVTFVVSGGSWNGTVDAPSEIDSGDDIVLTEIKPEMSVRLIWEDPETGDSYVLYTWRGPQV